MMEDLITYDIEKYIDSILHQDDAFEQWDSEIKATIKNKLLENAGGMYVCANLKKRLWSDHYSLGFDWSRCRWMNYKTA